MNACRFCKEQAQRLWRFLGFFQPPQLRIIHLVVILLVALQLISSQFMASPGRAGVVASMANTLHFTCGIVLVFLGIYFTGLSWRMRGLKRFYGYLWGEVEQLRKDIVETLHFRTVAPRPGGLATTVQGLGFGALLLAALSGLAWFVVWRMRLPYTHAFKEVHEALSTLIVLYFAGHGGMALLHFVLWQRKVVQKNVDE